MIKRKNVLSKLILDTAGDIPFKEAQVVIHQPTIKELSMIGGEQAMLIAAETLTKDYQNLDEVAKMSVTNFDIIMMIMKKNETIKKIVNDILFLLFPDYQIIYTPTSILLQEVTTKTTSIIDQANFEIFANIIYSIFCLEEFWGEGSIQDYNPSGPRAAALVEKFKKKKELLAEMKRQRGDTDENESLLQRYLSILAVGENKDKNILSNYTVFQLIEEYKRFIRKEEFDFTVSAKLAGAQKIKDAKDWMTNIQFGVNNNNQTD